jgi:hypothetical protein
MVLITTGKDHIPVNWNFIRIQTRNKIDLRFFLHHRLCLIKNGVKSSSLLTFLVIIPTTCRTVIMTDIRAGSSHFWYHGLFFNVS